MISSRTTKDNMKNMLIWAVDPSQNPDELKSLIKELKTWAKHLNCSIQPVSIFPNRILSFPVELAIPWHERFENIAQKSLDRFFKKVKFEGLLSPDKIFIPSNSRRKMALELSKYAEHKKALIIFANTRAKKTWNPFRLGGFVEMLIAETRTPVLLLNPEAKPTIEIPSILFPTDFSRDSKVALMNLSPWAKAFHSKTILFNQVETPTIYVTELNGYWPAESANLDAIMKYDDQSRQKKAKQWESFLKEINVDVKIIIQRQKNTLSSDILNIAKKNKVSLIALASHSGPIAQTTLGGVARDVLLQAPCPVLIFYRPKSIRKQIPELTEIVNKKYLRKAETTEAQHG